MGRESDRNRGRKHMQKNCIKRVWKRASKMVRKMRSKWMKNGRKKYKICRKIVENKGVKKARKKTYRNKNLQVPTVKICKN